MKKLLIIALFASLNAQAQEFYMEKQHEIEFTRLNQSVAQLKEVNEQQARFIRQLEKQNEQLSDVVKQVNDRMDSLLDLWVNFENVSLPNLIEADKTLSDRINDINSHIVEQTPTWDWGEQSRSCPKMGEHQQVRTVMTDDGKANVRYLCFDGKVIHLNTTSNISPVPTK